MLQSTIGMSTSFTRDFSLVIIFESTGKLENENLSHQNKILEKLSFGGGCINDCMLHLSNPNLPFGGVGTSGMGAYHGKASFDTFSHKKSVLMKSTKLDLKVMYPPYTKFKTNMAKKVL